MFFNDAATTEIYTLSLHDALPIYAEDGKRTPHEKLTGWQGEFWKREPTDPFTISRDRTPVAFEPGERISYSNRSEEHTSELQSHSDIVCRLLLEKKKHTGGRTRDT